MTLNDFKVEMKENSNTCFSHYNFHSYIYSILQIRTVLYLPLTVILCDSCKRSLQYVVVLI